MSNAKELPEALVNQLRDKHGEIAVVPTKCGPCAFRSPTRAEFKRYKSLLINEKTRAESFEVLVRSCVVHPELAVFETYLDNAPGLVDTALQHVLELAGVDAEAEAKKYVTGSVET